MVKHNKTKGWIVLDQIKTVDRQRIVKILDLLTDEEIEITKLILQETYID
jgi:mRNA interferase MazF